MSHSEREHPRARHAQHEALHPKQWLDRARRHERADGLGDWVLRKELWCVGARDSGLVCASHEARRGAWGADEREDGCGIC